MTERGLHSSSGPPSLQNSPCDSRLYDIDELCLGLAWCTRSITLYCEIRKHIQLPSLTTLARITRTAKNTTSEDLFHNVFSGLEDRSQNCLIFVGEIIIIMSRHPFRIVIFFCYDVDQPEKKKQQLYCL